MEASPFTFGFGSSAWPAPNERTSDLQVGVVPSSGSHDTLVLVEAVAPPPPRSWPFVAVTGTPFVRVLPEADAVTGLASDRLAGAYEGGAKQWECTHDLLRWMSTPSAAALTHGAIVLDLGCGAGLAGIAALRGSAARCIFQDLNVEVLREVTLRNLVANAGAAGTAHTTLLAGTWDAAISTASSDRGGTNGGRAGDVVTADPLAVLRGGVDLILSSETLYNVAHFPSLLRLLDAVLKPEGLACFASKRHYFGVGGGATAFTAAAVAAGWDVRTVASVEDGRSMVRDVLEVRRRLGSLDGSTIA